MIKWITPVLLLLGLSGQALADHRWDRGFEAVARSAHAMDNAAHHFYQQVRYHHGDAHATRDAKRLARAAEKFHRRVERGASLSRLQRDYDRLARAFDDASFQFSDRRYRHRDHHRGRVHGPNFYPVARAFQKLDRTLYAVNNRGRRDERYGSYQPDERYGAGLALLSLVLEL